MNSRLLVIALVGIFWIWFSYPHLASDVDTNFHTGDIFEYNIDVPDGFTVETTDISGSAVSHVTLTGHYIRGTFDTAGEYTLNVTISGTYRYTDPETGQQYVEMNASKEYHEVINVTDEIPRIFVLLPYIIPYFVIAAAFALSVSREGDR